MSRAVVLLSGGLDSYTAAAVAQRDGAELYALTVNYGQRHARELTAARAVAERLGVARLVEIDIDLSRFGGSALTGDIDVPKDRPQPERTASPAAKPRPDPRDGQPRGKAQRKSQGDH